MRVTINGASDDIIEIGGDLSQEFYPPSATDDSKYYVAVSDGTVLRVAYDDAGCWRINCVVKGGAKYQKVEAIDVDADERADGTPGYSDVVTLTGDNLRWALGGTDLAK